MRRTRQTWIHRRQPCMRCQLCRLVFIDETVVKTNLMRLRGARTYDDLIDAVGDVCNLFHPEECLNFFIVAGPASD